MKKKILAAALAMTMMLGSSVGALASPATVTEAPDGVYGQAVEASSTLNTPTIEIEVPTALEFVLNPYQMGVTPTGGTETFDQVVAADSTITNKSNVAVSVNVMDLGMKKEEGSELTLLAAPPTAGLTTKSAFLYVDLAEAGDDYAPYKASNKTQLAVPVTKTVSKTDMLTLDVGSTTNTVAKIRVSGNIVANPTKAWSDKDIVGVTFKLTFTPQVNKPASN